MSLSASAEPVRPRPTQAEALARVGKLHAVMVEVQATIHRAKGKKNAADDEGVVALDTSSGSVNVGGPCSGGGSFSGTYSASSTASGTNAGSGSGSYSITFTNCTLGSSGSGGDATNGNITYNVTVSGTGSSGGATTTGTTVYTYTGGTLRVAGPNAGTYLPAGLTVTTVQAPSSSTPPQTTVDGTAIIDGNPYKFVRDPVR